MERRRWRRSEQRGGEREEKDAEPSQDDGDEAGQGAYRTQTCLRHGSAAVLMIAVLIGLHEVWRASLVYDVQGLMRKFVAPFPFPAGEGDRRGGPGAGRDRGEAVGGRGPHGTGGEEQVPHRGAAK